MVKLDPAQVNSMFGDRSDVILPAGIEPGADWVDGYPAHWVDGLDDFEFWRAWLAWQKAEGYTPP
jgi:hypothetical protein